MGHRMEIYLAPEDAQAVIDLAQSFGIEAKIVGRVEESATGNRLTIKSEYGVFEY
jgi:phosphoribosylformylglycinamidine cyclo-ligase